MFLLSRAGLDPGVLPSLIAPLVILLPGGLLTTGIIELTEASHPLGPTAPWFAVAVFGVGIVVHQYGRRDSIGWILLVLYVAYGAQVIGDVFFGGVLSALVGALAMTPVAIIAARQPSGPPAVVSFRPAFWLLVPGALGLLGVTSILDGDAAGATTMVTTVSTMVAIALGVLAGSALSGSLRSSRSTLL